jgi:prolyl-tRNA synthetase
MSLDDLLKILATNTHDNDYIINFMAKRDSFVFDRYKRESTHAYSIPVVTEVDTDDQNSPGRKYAEYELKGVPVRIAVGPRDMQNGTVELYRRDTGEKQTIKREDVVDVTMHILHDMQKTLRTKNKLLREANTVSVTTYEEFKKALDDGKFVMAHRDGTAETEEKIKEECKCVTRCIPFNAEEEQGICVYTGKPSTKRVLFARAY